MKTKGVLTLLICTCSNRIERVQKMLLPQHEDIRYVISWQNPPDEESERHYREVFSGRDDVLLTTLKYHSGLSANRNNAFQHWHTEFGLICDDDEVFSVVGLLEIVRQFKRHPRHDILCFKAQNMQGKALREYSSKSFEYSKRPRFTYFCSFEIALRRTAALPYFDERFGLQSAHLCCGEEEVFLEKAHQKGLRIRYIPIFICQTADLTTTTSSENAEKILLSKGGVLRLMHGKWNARLRCLKYALTNQPANACKTFKTLNKGIDYIDKTHSIHLTESENTKPFLSIVIPAHNRADLLSRTLASLERMCYRNIDLIFVDDHSTDGTWDLLNEFKQNKQHLFHQVSVIHNPAEHCSAAGSRNAGFETVKIDYVYFFDSDDEISPDFTLDAITIIGHHHPDMLCCGTNMVFENGKVKKRDMPHSLTAVSHILTGALSTQSVIINSEFLRKIGGWNNNLRQWDDWELGVRLLLHARRFLLMPKSHYHRIYQHENGLTGEKISKVFKNFLTVFSTVKEDIEKFTEIHKSLRIKLYSSLAAKIYVFDDNLLKHGNLEKSKELRNFVKDIPVSTRMRWIIKATHWLPSWAKKGMWRIYFLFL